MSCMNNIGNVSRVYSKTILYNNVKGCYEDVYDENDILDLIIRNNGKFDCNFISGDESLIMNTLRKFRRVERDKKLTKLLNLK